MTTLTQYWTGEVGRLTPALGGVRTELALARADLIAAQAASRLASDALRAARDEVDAARTALAGIPMPADGDPLLDRMSDALVAWREAQQAGVRAELVLQAAKADAARLQAQEARLAADLVDAQAATARETRAAAERQAAIDALTTGPYATISADAAQALTDFEATARGRVEGEFPANAAPERDLLTRVRARRALVVEAVNAAAEVETAAYGAGQGALAVAQRRLQLAWEALRALADAAPRLPEDRAVLMRLAALPAPNPPGSFPIVTPAQHAALFDADLQAVREDTLLKLKAADDAHQAWQVARTAYDKALHAAMKQHPDHTVDELNAAEVAAEWGDLDTAAGALQDARDDLEADAGYDTLQAWLAAVPEPLWDALEQLDATVARLTLLKGPPTAATLIADLAARESDCTAALSAARLAVRAQEAAALALDQARVRQQALRDTILRRARAASRGTAAL